MSDTVTNIAINEQHSKKRSEWPKDGGVEIEPKHLAFLFQGAIYSRPNRDDSRAAYDRHLAKKMTLYTCHEWAENTVLIALLIFSRSSSFFCRCRNCNSSFFTFWLFCSNSYSPRPFKSMKPIIHFSALWMQEALLLHGKWRKKEMNSRARPKDDAAFLPVTSFI